jgi:putative transcriptional regulator
MHETMSGMYEAGVVGAHTMRKFDAMCLPKGEQPDTRPRRSGVARRYRYLGCGLDNIHLRNGYEFRQTQSGTELVWIDDVKGLHRAIAQQVSDLPRPLTPKEFKFLRKELDLSQRQVTAMMRVDEQIVSLSERGNSPINPAAEMLLRVLMKETLSGNAEVKAALERYSALDREERASETALEFEMRQHDWRLAA